MSLPACRKHSRRRFEDFISVWLRSRFRLGFWLFRFVNELHARMQETLANASKTSYLACRKNSRRDLKKTSSGESVSCMRASSITNKHNHKHPNPKPNPKDNEHKKTNGKQKDKHQNNNQSRRNLRHLIKKGATNPLTNLKTNKPTKKNQARI